MPNDVPAFPSNIANDVQNIRLGINQGMTLRDYFAGQIIAGLTVGCAGMIGNDFSAYAKGHCNSALAERAYVLADALLLEREKGKA